jgi:putative CGCGG family rSAM target protein
MQTVIEKNWSISLESDEYVNDFDALVNEAIAAVKSTQKGFYVNLVTPGVFGNPEDYLTEVLQNLFSQTIEMKYIDQCGCGGHVLRVHKLK